MMAQRIISDCTISRLPVEGDACAPVIDAEKSNEALRMVALIRNHTGSGFMAFTAE